MLVSLEKSNCSFSSTSPAAPACVSSFIIRVSYLCLRRSASGVSDSFFRSILRNLTILGSPRLMAAKEERDEFRRQGEGEECQEEGRGGEECQEEGEGRGGVCLYQMNE